MKISIDKKKLSAEILINLNGKKPSFTPIVSFESVQNNI